MVFSCKSREAPGEFVEVCWKIFCWFLAVFRKLLLTFVDFRSILFSRPFWLFAVRIFKFVV